MEYRELRDASDIIRLSEDAQLSKGHSKFLSTTTLCGLHLAVRLCRSIKVGSVSIDITILSRSLELFVRFDLVGIYASWIFSITAFKTEMLNDLGVELILRRLRHPLMIA